MARLSNEVKNMLKNNLNGMNTTNNELHNKNLYTNGNSMLGRDSVSTNDMIQSNLNAIWSVK